MHELPPALRDGLDAATAGIATPKLAGSVRRLITAYRSGRPADAPILASDVDVAAYAAYRMPATYAAVRAALEQVAQALPGFAPRRLVDVAGGTGAAAWAAVDAFSSLVDVAVLDQVPEALTVGRRLGGGHPVLRSARWERWRAGAAVPDADLVTVSYLVGELPEPQRAAVLDAAVAAGGAVVVIEPGTPAGHHRVLAAREILLGHGLTVVAPCPHQGPCPLAEPDWCHFAARVPRSPLHRRLKEAELGHEDEKFSMVAAVPGVPEGPPWSRVLRRPGYRKGLVELDLCTPAGTAELRRVSRKEGVRYRAARDVGWGSVWPGASPDHS